MLNTEQQQYIDALKNKYPDISRTALRSMLEEASWPSLVIDEAEKFYFLGVATPPQPLPVPPVQVNPTPALYPPAQAPATPQSGSAQGNGGKEQEKYPPQFNLNQTGKFPLPIPILAGVSIIVIAIVIVVAYFVFSGSSKKDEVAKVPVDNQNSQVQPTANPNTNTSNKNIPVANTAQPNDLVAVVYKDSVLRSIDGGEVFDKYFSIATTSKIGVADVLSISFHPLVKDRVVVTTYQDGLFFNEGRENKWVPVPFPPQRIYSFILDRNSPDNRIFASGVVENNGRIFRTSDAGKQWRAVYAEPGIGTYVSSIAQDPKKINTIIAGTNAGTVIKSSDGGDTWKNVGQKLSGNISTLGFDAVKNSFIYLLSLQSSMYYSPDGGLTWYNWEEEKLKELYALQKRAQDAYTAGDMASYKVLNAQANALSLRNQDNRQPTGMLLVVPSPTLSGVIYTGTSNGLYRSDDYGKYWSKLNIIESAEGYPIRSIAINPKNSKEIVFVSGKSFYKSKNGGETWATVPLDNSRNASFVAYDPFDSRVIFIGMSSI